MVSQVRILLCGPVGSGKSSFINSVNTVLQGRNTTDALADSIGGVSFTVKFKTYKLKKDRAGSFFPFVFNDTMGMEAEISHGIQTNDLISILQGHVQEGYTFNPLTELTDEKREYDQTPSLDGKVHCLVSILPADKISMMPQSVICEMRKVREKARDLEIPQVVIMTRVDLICKLVSKDLKMIYRSKKIKDKIEECSNRLGVTKNYIFPVKMYSEEITTNSNVDILILMAMTNIVNFANDFVEREYQ
ncbi:interferon-induced protein 44-like isoform X2 [Colossoma macropomum]|nr:interferon-induced protein 44-like isoform X2 [Colossoma macropomum]